MEGAAQSYSHQCPGSPSPPCFLSYTHPPPTPRPRPVQVVLPLELNTRVMCRWKDGEFYRCKLLERRLLPEFKAQGADGNPDAWEYYVHFSGSESTPGGGGTGAARGPQQQGAKGLEG